MRRCVTLSAYYEMGDNDLSHAASILDLRICVSGSENLVKQRGLLLVMPGLRKAVALLNAGCV
jgi:hypothetical protein